MSFENSRAIRAWRRAPCHGPGRWSGVLAVVLATSAASAQGSVPQDAKASVVPAGTYRAWLDSPGGELPFGLKLEWEAGARTPGAASGEKGLLI